MSTNKIVLDDDQRFALMKFRRSVADVLQSKHNDQFLLRWLKARNWDPAAAEKMLRASLNWREQWEVDTVIPKWEPPEVIKLYHPSGVSGYDKCGSPVVIVPFAGLDMIGLLHSSSKQDLTKMTIQILERNLGLALENGANEVFVIFDMEGFSLRQYAWRPAAELVISLIQMYEANYPEILRVCYIINAPAVFAIAFNVVKRFLNDYTLSKIHIFKNEPKKWRKVILDQVEPDNLPMHYGGNLCDPDGNPKLTTKINQGGKVPKKYYTKNLDSTTDYRKEYTTAVIKKGEKLVLDFIVADKGSYLKWEFSTDDHDIRFGVTQIDEGGKESPVVRYRRVPSHQMKETGVISCQAPATYIITFDNTYSMFRSKKIHYNIEVVLPVEKLDIISQETLNVLQEKSAAAETSTLDITEGSILSNGNTIESITSKNVCGGEDETK